MIGGEEGDVRPDAPPTLPGQSIRPGSVVVKTEKPNLF